MDILTPSITKMTLWTAKRLGDDSPQGSQAPNLQSYVIVLLLAGLDF